LFNLHEQSSRKGTRHVREVLQPVVDEIIEQYQNKGHIASGLQLGLTDLDRVLNGLKTGLFVIAARPSKGKTVLACQIALNVGCGMGHYKEFRQDRKPVLFFSLETTDRALTRRMLFNRWTVPISQARTGLMSRIQQDDLQRAVGELKGSEIYLHESFGMSIQELRATARMMVARHGIKLIIVDYLQLLTSSSKAAQYSRQAMIAEVSTGLKHLAHEFDISVIALAQLNRDGDKARPSMADLRESGQIEQDADYIGMICDAGQGGDEDEVSADEFMGLDIAKNKDGPTTTDGTPMVLYFDKSIFRLRSWTDSLLSNNTAKYQAGYDKPKGKKPGGKNEPTWSKLHEDD
jgi:replicative DNA helicase